MAIQISEKFLSPRAVAALNKAPNKSQFLRDAIEYYVNRGPVNISSRIPGISISDVWELQSDIKDIKELLNRIVDTESVSAAEVAASQTHNDFNRLSNPVLDEKAVNEQQPMTSKEDMLTTTNDLQNNHNNKREEIEQLLDDSISFLFDQ